MASVAEVNAVVPTGTAILQQIPGGGQREVFRGTRNGQEIVLKLMPAADRDRAEREVAAGYGIQHPNLVEILDPDVRDVRIAGCDYCYFTEAFVVGSGLRTELRNMQPCDVLKLANDVASAIDHLWSRRIVHRDIKPENIIRAHDGRFVLLDVGIGRHQLQPSLTTPFGAPGTPGYFSPEMLMPTRRRMLDFRSDLFLIGVVCYEALEGSIPFDPRQNDYAIRLMDGPPPLSAAPPPVAAIVRRLLAPRAHQRYARIDQLKADIDAARGALGCT